MLWIGPVRSIGKRSHSNGLISMSCQINVFALVSHPWLLNRFDLSLLADGLVTTGDARCFVFWPNAFPWLWQSGLSWPQRTALSLVTTHLRTIGRDRKIHDQHCFENCRAVHTTVILLNKPVNIVHLRLIQVLSLSFDWCVGSQWTDVVHKFQLTVKGRWVHFHLILESKWLPNIVANDSHWRGN